ncbi:unnamed protein product [Closterium sp. NIES-64]|nr:unnamed protein product [Closterium sp. NIES-64]
MTMPMRRSAVPFCCGEAGSVKVWRMPCARPKAPRRAEENSPPLLECRRRTGKSEPKLSQSWRRVARIQSINTSVTSPLLRRGEERGVTRVVVNHQQEVTLVTLATDAGGAPHVHVKSLQRSLCRRKLGGVRGGALSPLDAGDAGRGRPRRKGRVRPGETRDKDTGGHASETRQGGVTKAVVPKETYHSRSCSGVRDSRGRRWSCIWPRQEQQVAVERAVASRAAVTAVRAGQCSPVARRAGVRRRQRRGRYHCRARAPRQLQGCCSRGGSCGGGCFKAAAAGVAAPGAAAAGAAAAVAAAPRAAAAVAAAPGAARLLGDSAAGRLGCWAARLLARGGDGLRVGAATGLVGAATGPRREGERRRGPLGVASGPRRGGDGPRRGGDEAARGRQQGGVGAATRPRRERGGDGAARGGDGAA